jgi:hypothetical protein
MSFTATEFHKPCLVVELLNDGADLTALQVSRRQVFQQCHHIQQR